MSSIQQAAAIAELRAAAAAARNQNIITSYQCMECGKHFKRKSYLEAHEKIHQNIRPFACSDCDKCFRQSTHLAQHMRIHNNIRPFVCYICSKGFKQKTTLDQHLLIHMNVKPFQCDKCEKKFRQKSALFKHEQNIHNAEVYQCTECSCNFSQETGLLYHNCVKKDVRTESKKKSKQYNAHWTKITDTLGPDAEFNEHYSIVSSKLTKLRDIEKQKQKEIDALKKQILKDQITIKQQQETIFMNHRLLKIRCALINSLQEKEQTNCIISQNLNPEINKNSALIDQMNYELSAKAEELQNLLSTLGTTRIELGKQKRIIKLLEDGNDKLQKRRIRDELRIAKQDQDIRQLKEVM